MAQRNQWNPLGPSVTGLARVEGENATYTRTADKLERHAGPTLIAGLRGRPDPGPKSGTFGTG